jgi:hypothetical protein
MVLLIPCHCCSPCSGLPKSLHAEIRVTKVISAMTAHIRFMQSMLIHRHALTLHHTDSPTLSTNYAVLCRPDRDPFSGHAAVCQTACIHGKAEAGRPRFEACHSCGHPHVQTPVRPLSECCKVYAWCACIGSAVVHLTNILCSTQS